MVVGGGAPLGPVTRGLHPGRLVGYPGSMSSTRPGRLTLDELRLALSAPRARDGFVSRRLWVRGVSTHYRMSTRAPAAPMPVVLVHGLAVSHRYLMPTARALSGAHPVYVPDLPGFGLSGKPRAVYGVAEHARHLAAWLGGVGLPAACLLGTSFGCEVAAALAAEYPHLAAALVLVGPTSDPAARTRRAQIGRWLRDVVREDKRQAPILLRDAWDAGPRRVATTLGHSVRNAVERALRSVEAPTLLLRGSRDLIAPPGWLAEAARVTRNSMLGEIPGAAHNAITTAGPQVAATVRQFLAGIPRRTVGNRPGWQPS